VRKILKLIHPKYILWAKVNHDWKPEVLSGVIIKASCLLDVTLRNPEQRTQASKELTVYPAGQGALNGEGGGNMFL
jgi:hypothetical protein